jgi:amino acid adenylation domain-containing protein
MYPDRVAVSPGDRLLTYDELNQAANRLARKILDRQGIKNEPVAILLEHGADIIIAILAVWKAGKIYVPLDPTLPLARNKAILDATQAHLVVTRAPYRDYLGQTQKDLHWISIDELSSTVSAENVGAAIAPDHLAYILFTSGSTGQPKGVMQNHRNVLHQIKRETNGLRFCADDRLILLRSCSAIGGMRIVLCALLNGATVHPFNVTRAGHAELAELLARENITIYDSTPTTFRQFIADLPDEQRFPHLRLIRLSSEPVHQHDVELYKKYFSQGCIFTNSLGLTETGGSIRQNLIDQNTNVMSTTVPVGYAVEDMDVVILDDDGHEVGPEEVGEIAVSSSYLSPGYWRNPDLTNEKFAVDSEDGNKRLYLTGDVGQMLSDGCLVHLGRKDFQVKVRGYKIDVAEVERAILDLPSVKAAVVVARADSSDEQCIVAYWIPAATPVPSVSSLRRALSNKLPEYMIPSCFVTLDALPTTPTGKVDRKALPVPDRVRPVLEAVFVKPSSETEKLLAAIWQQVLRLDKIGIDDNFFDLGGNSLRLAEVNRKVNVVFQRTIPLMDMLALPTIRTLAEYMARAENKVPALKKSRDRADKRRASRDARKRPRGTRS